MEASHEAGYVKLVTVGLNRVRASSFSQRDNQVVLELYFNDGNDKQIFRTTTISAPDATAEQVLRDIIRMEENINKEFEAGEFVGEARVMIKNYEEVRERLTKFFKSLAAKMGRARGAHTSEGYMDLVRDINRMELNLGEGH